MPAVPWAGQAWLRGSGVPPGRTADVVTAQRADRGATIGLIAICAFYAVALTLLGWDRYAAYHSGADLGEFVQTISTPFSGFGDTPEGGSHFLHHFSPLLLLCSPLLLLTHSPVALVAIQAVSGALVAPPVYLLVRKRAGTSLAFTAALISLLYPALMGVTFTDFHENGFAPAMFAWLAWAVDARRWRLAVLFVFVGLGIKEDEAGMFCVLGAGFAVWSRRRGDGELFRFACFAAIAGAVTLAMYFLIIWPLAGGHGHWFGLSYVADSAPDRQTGLSAILGRMSFLLEALVPLCFIPAFTRRFLIVIPGLVLVLSSQWSITYTMGQHYAGVWAGEMIVVFALTLAAIATERSAKLAMRLAIACIVLCVINLSVASPTHWKHYLSPVNAHDRTIDAFIASLPPDASVGTHDELYSHLGFDRNARNDWNHHSVYILVDDTYPSDQWRNIGRPQIDAMVAAHAYVLLRAQDGIELYHRLTPPEPVERPRQSTSLRSGGSTSSP